jgi:hypothetical protein
LTRGVTKQNLELLIEALLAEGVSRYIWYAGHDDHDGASLHFGDGHELSIRWGLYNYASSFTAPRTTVEVALFRRGRLVQLEEQNAVLGWQTFEDIAALAQAIADEELDYRAMVSA